MSKANLDALATAGDGMSAGGMSTLAKLARRLHRGSGHSGAWKRRLDRVIMDGLPLDAGSGEAYLEFVAKIRIPAAPEAATKDCLPNRLIRGCGRHPNIDTDLPALQPACGAATMYSYKLIREQALLRALQAALRLTGTAPHRLVMRTIIKGGHFATLPQIDQLIGRSGIGADGVLTHDDVNYIPVINAQGSVSVLNVNYCADGCEYHVVDIDPDPDCDHARPNANLILLNSEFRL